MPDVFCGICKKAFYTKPNWIRKGWGKYCSTRCRSQAQFNGKKISCSTCQKRIYRSKSSLKKSKSGKYFCCKKCQTFWRNSYFRREKHKNWRGGVQVYRQILQESGVVIECVVCKIRTIQILTAHHKDHNRKNNDISNLLWLCLNCHYLVHHNKSLDKKIKRYKYEQSLYMSDDLVKLD